MPTIACQYCGATHASADEVRACWERSQDAEAAPRVEVTSAAPGRSVVVRPSAPAPAGWEHAERVTVTKADDATASSLASEWRERRPLVVELTPGLGLDDPASPPDEVRDEPLWELGPHANLTLELLHHALWANAADARTGTVVEPVGDGGPLTHPDAWGLDPGSVVHRIAVEHGSTDGFGPNRTNAELAPDQLAAVTHVGGAARIIAPAGSGKTRVLTERARLLLSGWALPASAVCLVAFNVRAAQEMRDRTTDLPGLQIRTLNSLALAIVNGTPPFASGRQRQTIDERAVRRIIDDLVDVPRRSNTDPVAAWIEALSAVRLGLRHPLEVEAEFGGDVDGLADVVPRYRAALADGGVIDFDEQIVGAIDRLLTEPLARRRAQRACRVLLVDEFQDLTPAHLLLIRLVAGPAGNVYGVGDDDQTIYGYSGASPEWLLRYTRSFPTASEHALEINYRCPAPVVRAAATLLTHNRRRVDKVIRPVVDAGGSFEVIDGGDDPVAASVAAVRARLAQGAAPVGVAVLARVHSALAPVQVALRHEGIPVNRAVGESFLERTGVRAALAWLRIASSGRSRLPGADLGIAIRRPSRGVSGKLAEWVSEQRDVQGLRRLATRLSRERDAVKVEAFTADVELVMGEQTTGAVLLTVRDRIGLDATVAALDGAHRRLDRSAQGDDLDALVALAKLHDDPSTFEGWLRDALTAESDPDGVALATVHAVKGREWPHVVVHHATAGLLPHRLVEDVEEERRVFHVAITRGIESVAVVHGQPASPFVAELSEPWDESRRPVRTVRPSAVAAKPIAAPLAPTTPAQEAAVASLRAWRTAKAQAAGKPAYIFLTDETLLLLAARLPANLAEMARVKGIGPMKLEQFGDELLGVLADHRPG